MINISRLIDIPENEEFLVHTRASIVALLRQLMRQNDPIIAVFSDGEETLTTTVLHVNNEKGLVVLEYGQNPELSRKMLSSRDVLFDIKQNSIILQFTARSVRHARLKGESVFVIPLPDKILRLQRREYYRLDTTSSGGMQCTLTTPYGDKHIYTIEDISVGGLGLVDQSGAIEFVSFQVFNNALVNIDGIGTMTMKLQVRNTHEETNSDGKLINRIGMAFMELTPDQENKLQRYINRQQMEEQRKRAAVE
jgi:c-di-GMP-binding flagellar brake protein YcgR